jgi:hypothetical protein
MSKQSLAVRSTGTGSGAAAAELIAAATSELRVTEIDISMGGPAGGTFGIGFPAAIGITPTTPVTLQSHDARDPSPTGTVALAWGTGPTVPAQFLYRVTVAAATAAAANISIPEGIVVPPGKSLVVWNISNTDVADITFIVSLKPLAQTLANF